MIRHFLIPFVKTSMNKKRYLQILVYFARADSMPDPAEISFIREVGKRIELEDHEIEEILDSDPQWEPELPKSEVERFILFDDILDLIAADQKLTEGEEAEARKIATKLGFLPSMVDEIFRNLRRLMADGIKINKIPEQTNRSSSYPLIYGKYNQ